MVVLLSVKPQFAERIFDGTKKYEYRKNIFSRTDIEKIVVYASNPVRRIIGEFEIEHIYTDTPKALWTKTSAHAGVDKDFFFQYFAGRNKAYAICIKSTMKYNVPINPRSGSRAFVPPQSFAYLESYATPEA